MRTVLLAYPAVFALAAFAFPASATTVANGVVLFNQTDAVNGNVTPGDAPGFPVTISVSGSYRLSGNLAPPPGAKGIDVTAPEVTIDLFGFRMAGAGTAAYGIYGNQRALTVTGGTIRGFALDGIHMTSEQLLVTRMRISDNDYGIQEDASLGGRATISDSEIFRNSTFGVVCRDGCNVQQNNVSNNGAGVYLTTGAVLGNTFFKNTGDGLRVGTKAAVGNNGFIQNGTSIRGPFVAMQPNGCDPACPVP